MENTLIQHIEISPGIRGGKPRLAGTRITVADIILLSCTSNWASQ
jgi:uncharacterized protein (DUF433 family)